MITLPEFLFSGWHSEVKPKPLEDEKHRGEPGPEGKKEGDPPTLRGSTVNAVSLERQVGDVAQCSNDCRLKLIKLRAPRTEDPSEKIPSTLAQVRPGPHLQRFGDEHRLCLFGFHLAKPVLRIRAQHAVLDVWKSSKWEVAARKVFSCREY